MFRNWRASAEKSPEFEELLDLDELLDDELLDLDELLDDEPLDELELELLDEDELEDDEDELEEEDDDELEEATLEDDELLGAGEPLSQRESANSATMITTAAMATIAGADSPAGFGLGPEGVGAPPVPPPASSSAFTLPTAVPQLWQNLAPSGNSLPQLLQNMASPSDSRPHPPIL